MRRHRYTDAHRSKNCRGRLAPESKAAGWWPFHPDASSRKNGQQRLRRLIRKLGSSRGLRSNAGSAGVSCGAVLPDTRSQ